MTNYSPQKIEKKWQKRWEKLKIYKTPDKNKGKKNFYSLVMFPYPSGDLHIGHWFNFVGADVYSRYKRLQGFNVLHPIGFDAFGLPAENAAIKRRIHPQSWTYKNIVRMRKQLKSIGACYDWSREIITSDPEYYKWTQWLFLEFFKAGLVYRVKVPANFCPSCKTVLANEQVIEGKCERCESEVIQKEIEQWLFRITDYTEKLLKDLDYLDWPETSKIVQRNWIGKSEGWKIKFSIFNFQFSIDVFTTRIDTLFGCTYLVLAPEHPVIQNLKSKILNLKSVEKYIAESKKKTERERISENKEKTGIEIKGIKAINPVNGKEIPIFLADYVLVHYGTGAIMAVPAHDQRDFDFAKHYNLFIQEVIVPIIKADMGADLGQLERAYEAEGVLINSDQFTGMKSELAKVKIGEFLAKKGLAKKAVYFKLKDWLVSRQRYWGAPIPLVFCENCAAKTKNQKPKTKNFNKGELLNPGWIAVAEENLPVLLPRVKDYLPTGEGKSPLAKSKNFLKAKCPKCGNLAQRETDTMDTFVCSSWYYLAYPFWHKIKNEKLHPPKFSGKTWEDEKSIFTKYKGLIKGWLPVSMYIGGKEHITMHLLYARFFTKALRGLGYLDFKEPFLTLRHQGTILGPDFQKMSKSKGNIVEPGAQLKRHGTDVLRLYLCFMGPYEQGGPWNPQGTEGVVRFLRKVHNLANKKRILSEYKANINLKKLLHKTIKKVTEDIENFRFNTAISSLMILVNEMLKLKVHSLKHIKSLLLMLAPFAPHLTEELWQKHILKFPSSPEGQAYETGKFQVPSSIHNQLWPKYDEKLIKEKLIILIIQVNGRVRDKIEVEAEISEEKAKDIALSREKIKKWLAGKKIRKIIFVQNKLINIVI